MSDAAFRLEWARYEHRNRRALQAEASEHHADRIYLRGRSTAHLTFNLPGEPVLSLCGAAPDSWNWRGRKTLSEELRAEALPLCRKCSAVFEEVVQGEREIRWDGSTKPVSELQESSETSVGTGAQQQEVTA